ncbi:MAG: hypothetical protein OXF88_05585 [Rhodobacteraceae bacterium]|nr:hypothetical protein [Paracoccaceae bacterium]
MAFVAGEPATGYPDSNSARKLLETGTAADILSEALSAARSVTNTRFRARALASVAEAKAKAGDLSEAPVIVEANPRPTQQVDEQPQEAAVACDDWNTKRFFRQASAADVIRCLETKDPMLGPGIFGLETAGLSHVPCRRFFQ